MNLNSPGSSALDERAEEPRIATGSNGAGLLRRLYRRSPLRYAIKVTWAHRGLQPNDVQLAAYPRSGGVWLRFLLVEMLSGDVSFPRARREAGYVGLHHGAPELVPGGGRLIKTHEPYMARYRRAIHQVRDPRDVVLSYFSFMQRIGKLVIRPGDDLATSFDHFVSAFLAGRLDGHGTWQTHLLSWSRAASEQRADILRIRYEDMRADTPAMLMKIAGWLAHPLTLDEAAGIAERCSIERMREAEDVAIAQPSPMFTPRFVRTGLRIVNTGRVEGWREKLTPDQQQRFRAMADGLALVGYPPA